MGGLNGEQEKIIASISGSKSKGGRPRLPESQHKVSMTVTIDPDVSARIEELRKRRGTRLRDLPLKHATLSSVINDVLRQWAFDDNRDESERQGQQYRKFIATALDLSARARRVLNEQALFSIEYRIYFTLQDLGELAQLTPERYNPPQIPEHETVTKIRNHMYEVLKPSLRDGLTLMERKALSKKLMSAVTWVCDVLDAYQQEYDRVCEELKTYKSNS